MIKVRHIVQVAVPSPLPRLFDYLSDAPLAPGSRVWVPFGRRRQVGVVVGNADDSCIDRHRLKPVEAVIDTAPLIPAELLEFALWASRYYHHPAGEVLQTILPPPLRQGAAAQPVQSVRWRLTAAGRAVNPDELARRAPRQAELLRQLALGELSDDRVAADGARATLRSLAEKHWIEAVHSPSYGLLDGQGDAEPLPLTEAQRAARDTLRGAHGFACHLLDGVTGSGKTEVYLEAIDAVLAQGQQALVLVPEIGLTPQLVARFAHRFRTPMAVFHSALSDRERLNAWLAARDGAARIVIGTRSAVFTPLAQPGLIIVDEEHDPSFKQQDGFRYSARDLAVVRARRLDIPVVLGSATPSLESLFNVAHRGYVHLKLPERAGSAGMPRVLLLDIRGQPLQGGLSQALLAQMRRHLDDGNQVLIFLNRRGFAPTLLCHDCGWVAACARCDARLTLHFRDNRLRCHHCGHERPAPSQCTVCGSAELRPLGQGTERIEEALRAHFPDLGLVRIDRDSTRRKGAMAKLLASAHSGEGRILIGTQMLAKGHHLPRVTLVGIVDADSGLFGSDFRSTERLAQLIVQVAGRAGRADRPGEVILQTHHPEHPLLHTLLRDGYGRFAEALMEERRQLGLPPFGSLALLRAEAVQPAAPAAFLEEARQRAEALGVPGVLLLGPVPAPMERRAGRFRAQLLLQAARRQDLQRLLGLWCDGLPGLKSARKVRWSLDVDPQELL